MTAGHITDLGHVFEVTVIGYGYPDVYRQAERAVPGSRAFRARLEGEAADEGLPSLFKVWVKKDTT